MRNKIDIDYIRKELKKMNPNVVLISTEYVNNRTPLEFICSCGKPFKKRWDNIVGRGNCCCRSCGLKHGWKENRRDQSYDSFIEEIQKIFENHNLIIIEDLKDKIINKKTKILCKDKSGYKGRISAENVTLGKHFSVFGNKYNEDNLFYNLTVYAKNTQSNVEVKEILTKDKNVRTTEIKILCKCGCGELYKTNVGDFTTQNRVYCKKCTKNQSIFERMVKIEILKYTNSLTEQKRFSDCRNPKTNYLLPFDFYLDEYNICIETDGTQHKQPTNIRGRMNEEQMVENYLKTVEHDKIKNKYCEDKGITLIRIDYKDFINKKYKDIIKNLFNHLQTGTL